jgi:hypothetical protein
MQVISDNEGEDDPFICTCEERVGLAHTSKIQQVLAILVAAAVTSPSCLTEVGPLPRRPALRTVYHRLLSMCVEDAICLLCNLSTLVSYLSLKFSGPWAVGSLRWGL